MKETNILQECRLRASQLGYRFYRNNTGRLEDKNGRWVDFGLCVGSSDLIGPVPVEITEDMVGKTVALFGACEVKTPGKHPTDTQKTFLDVINGMGGVAVWATSADEFEKKMKDKIKNI